MKQSKIIKIYKTLFTTMSQTKAQPDHEQSQQPNPKYLKRISIAKIEKRQPNTFSMYEGVGRNKILPKETSKRFSHRRAQSTNQNHNGNANFKRQVSFAARTRRAEGGQSPFSGNPMKQYKRQTLRSKVKDGVINKQQVLRLFYQAVEANEAEFTSGCQSQNYSKAQQVVIKLLNYSIDWNLPQQFLRAMKILGTMSLLNQKRQRAAQYLNETRQGSLLLGYPKLLVESLIELAQCCQHSGLEKEGIKFLKKGLQYAWIYGMQQLQLRIYDQIGKIYYIMGDLNKAKKFHHRQINAIYEPANSSLRVLSRQRIKMAQEHYLQIKYDKVSMLLLVHLKVPVRNLNQVPLPKKALSTTEEPALRSSYRLPRQGEPIEDIASTINKILQNWFFKQQLQDFTFPEHQQTVHKEKKMAYLNFQLNQQLKRLHNNTRQSRKKLMNFSQFPMKQSLDQKVDRKMHQRPLEADWYQKIVKQINRDHRNKLLNIRDRVRLRGFNKKSVPQLQLLKDLYNKFFESAKGQQSEK